GGRAASREAGTPCRERTGVPSAPRFLPRLPVPGPENSDGGSRIKQRLGNNPSSRAPQDADITVTYVGIITLTKQARNGTVLPRRYEHGSREPSKSHLPRRDQGARVARNTDLAERPGMPALRHAQQ